MVIVEQELEALVLQRLCRVAGAPPHAENTGWSQRHIELPDGAVANAEMMWKRIGKEETLSMEFFTEKGTRRVLTRENLFELKEAGWDAQSLIKHINGEKKTWPLE